MAKIDKKQVAKVKRLCRKFHDDLQALFDEMDVDTYETSDVVQTSVSAQAYAYDAAEAED